MFEPPKVLNKNFKNFSYNQIQEIQRNRLKLIFLKLVLPYKKIR